MSSDIEPGRTTPVPGPAGARTDLVRSVMSPYARPIRKLQQYRLFDHFGPACLEKSYNPRELAAEWWQSMPDFPDLLDAMEAFEATFDEVDEITIRTLIGLMLDGLPSAKSMSSATYVDVLVFFLGDTENHYDRSAEGSFSALAIAAAVIEVWRTATFAPSPTEFLKLTNQKQREFLRASSVAGRLYDLRCQAEKVLIASGDIQFEASGDDSPF